MENTMRHSVYKVLCQFSNIKNNKVVIYDYITLNITSNTIIGEILSLNLLYYYNK